MEHEILFSESTVLARIWERIRFCLLHLLSWKDIQSNIPHIGTKQETPKFSAESEAKKEHTLMSKLRLLGVQSRALDNHNKSGSYPKRLQNQSSGSAFLVARFGSSYSYYWKELGSNWT